MGTAPAESCLSLEEVAKKTEGYSGDDLKNLVRKVKLRVAKRTEVIVTMDDFDNVLEKLNRERQNLKNKEKKV
ncbi:hypothetical protein [Wolbachia endosymbiont (group E) of Neria commutata]|uniref:hypothetical protein n=1 Tax=Wolbachia endosymbiont (group E) of Neria commutata TaxID=3066149 RepID=UPI003132B7B2